ncbi:hypothetical protein D3C87_1363780 [compost metagenome]
MYLITVHLQDTVLCWQILRRLQDLFHRMVMPMRRDLAQLGMLLRSIGQVMLWKIEMRYVGLLKSRN